MSVISYFIVSDRISNDIADGKKIYDKKDKNLKYKHDSELIQTLIGKEVLHYQTNKGYKIDNPYSFPKRLNQWRFDGVDAKNNLLFSKPAKGKEARTPPLRLWGNKYVGLLNSMCATLRP